MSANSATITLGVAMAGASFQSASVVITGETAPVVEATVAASATETMTGIVFPYNKCGMLYLLSDTTDCEVTFTNAGAAVVIQLVAGQPYLLYGETAVAAVLLRDVLTMTVENLNTTAGVANAVSTDFHARLVLSA